MECERVANLQMRLIEEAVSLKGIAMESELRTLRRAVELTGTAWKQPKEETRKLLAQIENSGGSGQQLPMHWSGMELFEAIEDLFECSVRLSEQESRKVLFDTAVLLREYESFLDWIRLSEQEKREFAEVVNAQLLGLTEE